MVGGEPKQRTKSSTCPPRVCPDCYWKRQYEQLVTAHLELRKRMMVLYQQVKQQNMRKRGSNIMPTSAMVSEVADNSDVQTLLDRLDRSKE